ncbi:hypothetical protein GQF01_30000 [Paenibacillus sp. 5J-6]|uniref:Uncharacterized protein n=1 Tax=Paenibacillus silvestris TaxID=2606219 RepID=A0A6L8V808_9BACL|nr:hypothetical protein [Paenibacillus silvestris]MZQ86344.1 hypothetical protein [Paenibacillus silvestris]
MRAHYEWQVREEDQVMCLTSKGQVIGGILPIREANLEVKDALEEIEEGVFRWSRTFVNQAEVARTCRLSMDFGTAYEPEYYMIPAVSYNGNEWGRGLEPKGLSKNGQPWTFAWHRTSVPGATYSEGNGWSIALFGESPRDMKGFSCSLEQVTGQAIHRLLWPEEEAPFTYSYRDTYSEAYRGTLHLSPGGTFEATAYLVVEHYERPRVSWRRMLDLAWRLHDKPLKQGMDAQRIWELSIDYARNGLWHIDGEFSGFTIGRTWKEGEWQQVRHYEIGWCGQNASLANSFLSDYLRSGNQDSLGRGLAVLDQWVEHGRLNNGLIHCHYDYLLHKRGEPEVQDACNLGTAALNLFEAEQLAAKCGVNRPSYREAALGICDFVVSVQAPEGRIGKSWRNDGTLADPEGTVGCFLVPPLVKAYELTGEAAYLEAAESGYRFYMNELLDNGYSTAGALDTSCIDKESAIPLLKSGLCLFKATANQTYLTWAEHAAWYLATWQWHHTVRYDKASELGRLEYDTFGGTSVSTQHHHIDPFALSFVEDWLTLAELTNNPTWRERAKAVWANAIIGISDGDTMIMGKQRPAGSQDEGYFHTRWGHDAFDVSQWLVAWPTAFRLELLRHLQEDMTLFPKDV